MVISIYLELNTGMRYVVIALHVYSSTASPGVQTPSVTPAGNNIGPTVGGVIGGVLIAIIIPALIICIVVCRRRRNKVIIHKTAE